MADWGKKMKSNNSISSHYEIVANAFKVVDISNPIFMLAKQDEMPLDVHMKLTEPTDKLFDLMDDGADQEEMFREMDKVDDQFCLVKDGEKMEVHWIENVVSSEMIKVCEG